jgi:hypothetical protein
MADEEDSKSFDGSIVWVQIPLPALDPNPGNLGKSRVPG